MTLVAVDICNLALGYLGDAGTVASINPPDGSVQSEHCARFYPMALLLMLEAHEWNFITKRVGLALLTTPYTDQWLYAYAMPADANSVLTIIPADCYANMPTWTSWRQPYSFEHEPRWRDFQVETNASNQQVVLSNIPNAIARYTSSQVSTNVFPALFTDALAWKLASMLAGPLLKGDVGAAESKRCLQAAAAIGAQAMSQDSNQRHDAPRPEPVWMRDR